MIKNVVLDPADDDGTYAVIIHNGSVHVGYYIYTDDTCQEKDLNIKNITGTGEKLFVQLNLKLYKDNSDQVFVSDGIYFRFNDIDSGQSYKILNASNQLTANKMYAKSIADLQPTDPNVTSKNMFNTTENYIYAEYGPSFNIIEEDSSLYVNIGVAAQQEGLDVVFGFTKEAGSGIEYYAKQYTVTYESDEGGTITGITEEDVISGDVPSGSTEEAKKDYELDYWKADKDVTLTDGTVIKAGEPITPEQIKKVVVNKDITFTAVYTKALKVPNTGASTEELNATIVALPIIGILLGALMIGLLPKLTHKKISFKK